MTTFLQDAAPVAITGKVGSTMSLTALLQQTYGADADSIQSIRIQVENPAVQTSGGSNWEQGSGPTVSTFLNNNQSIGVGNSIVVDKAHFGDIQVLLGNNMTTNLSVQVTESSDANFVGHQLYYTVVPQEISLNLPADHVPTATDIVAAAEKVAANETLVHAPVDCHNIATAIAASAGATLDPNTHWTGDAGQPQNEAGGFWRIAATNGSAGADWESKVQAGDIVRMERTDGGVHTVTVVAGLNADGNHPGMIKVVDNASINGSNGAITEHWQNYNDGTANNTTVANSVTIYRLTTDGQFLIDQSSVTQNVNILGDGHNDLIKVGSGSDTVNGGDGTDTAVLAGNKADYSIVNNADGSVTVSGHGATDKLISIEKIQFNDQTVDLSHTAPPPAGSVSISNVNIVEGNNGQQIETFTVTRSGGSAAFDVNFATADGTATTADGDYVAKSGTVHFADGVNTQTVSIVVNGDTKVEANETFNVNLSGATNGATIAQGHGVSTIVNDDAAPVAGSVAISNVNIVEGNNGQQIETFTLTRTGGNAAFDVNFATADGTATTADGDYVAKSGTVHFADGVNTQTVSIVVNGDTKVEANETFNVNLSGATNGATISQGHGVSTIVNDDAAPVAGSVAISNVNIVEGNNGQQIETFTVTRTGGSAAFDVNFATADGTATTADGDYVAKSGTVHFADGVNTQTVSIVVNGDTKVEANETFNVNLSGATNGATISQGHGVSTIINDDAIVPTGSVSINNVSITEGDNGTKIETFTVTRTGGNAAFDVNFATADGTATTANSDYVAKSGMLHFADGVNTQTISVVVNGDTKVEANETFNVNLSGATNGATISQGHGVGTIVNDDVAPATHHVANDFNGDGISDVLFGNNNGKLALWEMNGDHIVSNTTVGSVPAGWHVDSTADFSGDGKTDILLHNDSGQVALWQMDGDHVASKTTVGSVGSDWHVAGTGDFNGDGKADILWENSKGQVAMWEMNGNHIASNTTVGSVSSDWHVAGTGDFNGDGKADILWENGKGQVAVWGMDGDHIASNATVGSVGTDWHMAGTGDFNGDGKADILWENSKGQVAMWEMNGNHIASNTSVGSAPGWTVIGTGDYNHDGKADILLQNAKGVVAEWQMDGDHIVDNHGVGSHSVDWHVV